MSNKHHQKRFPNGEHGAAWPGWFKTPKGGKSSKCKKCISPSLSHIFQGEIHFWNVEGGIRRTWKDGVMYLICMLKASKIKYRSHVYLRAFTGCAVTSFVFGLLLADPNYYTVRYLTVIICYLSVTCRKVVCTNAICLLWFMQMKKKMVLLTILKNILTNKENAKWDHALSLFLK